MLFCIHLSADMIRHTAMKVDKHRNGIYDPGPPSTPVVVDGCLNPRKKGNMQTIQHELTPPQHSQPHPQPLKTTALVFGSTQNICYV